MVFSAIILGAGPNVGASVSQKLLKEGWKVALGSRNPDFETGKRDGFIPFKVDVLKSDSVIPALEAATAELGGPPNFVLYNVRRSRS